MSARTVIGIVIGTLVLIAAGGTTGYLVAEGNTKTITSTDTSTRTTTSYVTTTKTVTTETVVGPPAPHTLGSGVIADLLDQGAISGWDQVAPKHGWASEFKLDQAHTVIRFRNAGIDREVEWIYDTTSEGRELSDAIDEVTAARGFEES